MTQANRTVPDFLRSLEITMLAGELPPAEVGKAAPEWIKVTPKGTVTTRDGRPYTFDPAKLAARFRTDGTDVAVDTDHSVAILSPQGKTPNVVGYVKAVEARDDGTYGRVEWNTAGVAVVAAKTHRYVSPTFHHDDAGNATWLHSVALVPAPALANMPALAAALGLDGGPAPAQLAAVAGALGLAADAGEAAVLAAIGGLVPKATHEATLGLLASTSDKLAALTTSTHKADVERLVDGALREKKIVPAQRDGYLAMCSTEGGLATFRELMTKTPPGLQSMDAYFDGRRLEALRADAGPAAVQDIIDAARLHVAERAKLGILVTMPEAINAVAKRPTA